MDPAKPPVGVKVKSDIRVAALPEIAAFKGTVIFKTWGFQKSTLVIHLEY